MPPLSPARITQLYQQALHAQQAGRLDDAAAAYHGLLDARPAFPEVQFQLGRIALARKDAAALDHFAQAAALKPAEPAIWQGWADAAFALGDATARARVLAQAQALGVNAATQAALRQRLVGKAKAPGIGRANPANVKAVLADFNAGRMALAEAKAVAILRKAPDTALVADVLGNARMAQGNTAGAAEAFRQAVRLAPDWPEAQNNLGHVLLRLGRQDDALAALTRAVALAPGLAAAHLNIGNLWLEKADKVQALAAFRRAVDANPKLAEAQYQLGLQLYDARNYPAAGTALHAAAAAGMAGPDLQLRLGQVLLAQEDESGSMACFDRGLALAPDFAQLHSRKGLLLQRQGDFDAADACFRRAIALEPGNGDFYRLLMTTRKVNRDDPLIAEMQAQFENPAASDLNRMHLGFALSKAMEDTRQHARLFHYLRPANDLMHKAYPYDIATRRREVDGIMQAFAGFDRLRVPAPGSSDYAPIFVTGMPRSGTTLVEQIIASHSRVTGAGEVGHAAREAYKVAFDDHMHPRPYSRMSPEDVAGIGHRYEALMRRDFPDAAQVSDKSIQTYAFLGLIRQALPQSRIIVVRRDPRDTLLSIYRNVFLDGTHLYAYNLRDLGLYYRMFMELTDFWRALVPDWFHEVEYEALVANPEAEARKLIAACGLEWEDNCLNFYENKRRVDTLSVYQVRQPIYASSLAAWKRHTDDLAELFAALEGEDGA